MVQKHFVDMTYEEVINAYKQTVAGVCLMRLKNYADVDFFTGVNILDVTSIQLKLAGYKVY